MPAAKSLWLFIGTLAYWHIDLVPSSAMASVHRMIPSLYRMNFQMPWSRSIFVSERVITVSKPKDQKSFNQSRKTNQRVSIVPKERIKREKVQQSTENQHDPGKTKPKERPDPIKKPDKKVQIQSKNHWDQLKKLSHVQSCCRWLFVF